MGKVRKSNLELCRIICMFLIIAHHCVIHGGGYLMDTCANKYISYAIIPGGKLCFVTFLVLTNWFLTDKKFEGKRFFKIWLEVLFYSVLFTIVAAGFGAEINPNNWFSIFFPIAGNSHGFASSYMIYYLLIPFLQKVIKKITKRQLFYLISVLFYIQVISQLIGSIGQYYQPISSEVTLFILCFLITYYLKNYGGKLPSNKYVYLAIAILIWSLIFIIWCLNLWYPTNRWILYLMNFCNGESSILYLLGGYTLFLFFNKIKMTPSKCINLLASTTFGVLLIHDHNFFRYVLWNQIIKAPTWYYSNYYIVYILLSTIVIFAICFIIDYTRMQLLEKHVLNFKIINILSDKLNTILASPNE